MILFYEDWYSDSHRLAIPDTKTKNKSFLRMAGIFKRMGVKNHLFLLALHHPELQGVDPHSSDLTKEQKLLIGKEVKENPWYFFREVLRVPPPAGSRPISLTANRANIAVIWLSLVHVTSYLIQPRQTGKSLIGNAIDAYSLNIACVNTYVYLLTKDDKLRSKTAVAIRDLIEGLPHYLQIMNKKDIKNTEKITVKALQNEFTISVGQKDKKAADNIGRGETIPIVRIDEFGYIFNIETSLPVLLAATTAAREEAKRQNAPHYTMFTTTPGKLNSPDGRFAYSVYKESLRWSEKYYDVKDEDGINLVLEKNSNSFKVMLLEFNHRQLGVTDKWLLDRMSIALAKGENAESDYLNKWINGNVTAPIPKQFIELIVNSKINEPNPQITKYGYVLNWYINQSAIHEIKTSGFIVFGLDTSDALGGKSDGIGLVGRDSRTSKVVCGGSYNETNLSIFADFLVELLEEFPRSLLIPERRSSASAILDHMFRIMVVKRMNPFKRIFNSIVTKLLDNDITNKLLSGVPTLLTLEKYKKTFGFATSGGGENSRGLLYGNVFRASFTYAADKVHDPVLIHQLTSLKIVNNRIDHDSGEHDDMVIGWLLGYYVLQYGKNTHIYGLTNNLKLNSVIDLELTINNPDIDKKVIMKQVRLKDEAEFYLQKLRGAKNESIGTKLLTKINFIRSKIDYKIITNLNIESLLEDIKMYRKLKKK